MTRPGEFDFLVACCRSAIARANDYDVAALAQRVDWSVFHELVRRHRVERLVSTALSRNEIPVPDPLRREIERDARQVAERNLRFAQESHRLLNAFGGAGVRVIFVKGLTLSALAYGDPYLKTGCDIDILVEPALVNAAAQLLTSCGYEPVVPAVDAKSRAVVDWHRRRKESVWCKRGTGQYLDLHSALVDTPALIPEIGMKTPVQQVPIGNGRSLPTLQTSDLFAYLCVHGTWSAWFRLKWIADVSALLSRQGTTNIEPLYAHARTRGAGRAAAQALLLARELFRVTLPESLRREIEADRMNGLLKRLSMRELRQERAPTQRPLGTLGLHLLRPFLVPGWNSKFAEVSRQLGDVAHRYISDR